MRVVTNERIIPCDVDETLVMHSLTLTSDPGSRITVEDPLRPGKFVDLDINKPMLKIMMDEAARGAHILLWSRSGYQWAEAVAKGLGITEFIGTVMTKPVHYIDDKDVSEWMIDRVYVKPTTIYKKHTN